MVAMKNIIFQLSIVALAVFLSNSAQTSTFAEELDTIAGKVATLELGFGEYVLGKQLTGSQKKAAEEHRVRKALEGTYKFTDGEIFVIASARNDTVIGIYKEYRDAPIDTIKAVIGSLMFEHGEPTAMAHNKMIYWTYNEAGKIEQDQFDFQRDKGGVKSLVTVKFSSTEPIIEEKAAEEAGDRKLSAYVMITSDPLSKLFLAGTTREEQ